jgi:peptide methionine sulfoxide reductase MsrA
MTDKILEDAIFGMGCYRGAERRFWQYHPSLITAVCFAGGTTSNPTTKSSFTAIRVALNKSSESPTLFFQKPLLLWFEGT